MKTYNLQITRTRVQRLMPMLRKFQSGEGQVSEIAANTTVAAFIRISITGLLTCKKYDALL